MDSGKTVLVTAAAGGTGQFAVQVNFFPFRPSESRVLLTLSSVIFFPLRHGYYYGVMRVCQQVLPIEVSI